MKFSKDSVEWGIFGAVWKFYQEFYEPVDDDFEKYLNAISAAMTEMLEPLKGQPQYTFADKLFMACAMDMVGRYEEKYKEGNH